MSIFEDYMANTNSKLTTLYLVFWSLFELDPIIGYHKAKISEHESINKVAKWVIDDIAINTDEMNIFEVLSILYFSRDVHKIPTSQLKNQYKR